MRQLISKCNDIKVIKEINIYKSFRALTMSYRDLDTDKLEDHFNVDADIVLKKLTKDCLKRVRSDQSSCKRI